jgi:hypothetical protein
MLNKHYNIRTEFKGITLAVPGRERSSVRFSSRQGDTLFLFGESHGEEN